jgi:hypothetical protein
VNSGNWDAKTDRPLIEKYVRTHYADLADRWKLYFVGGGGNSFPLTKSDGLRTITEIGHRSISDSSALNFYGNPLYAAYGHLLSQLLYALEPPREDARAQDALRELALAFERRIRKPEQIVDQASLNRVNGILAKLPRTNVLKEALQSYEEFSRSRGLDFPRFPVSSNPAFDGARTWDDFSVVLPQSARCLGSVASFASPDVQLSADISFSPRILEVELARPWLSDELLNQAARDERANVREHFNFRGDLSIIPWRFWVLMPDQISFKLIQPSDSDMLKKIMDDGICCNVVCGTENAPLDPLKLVSSAGYWRSYRSDKAPLLYAIAAQSRQFQ